GRGGAAQGHALPLSQPVQSPDPVDRRRACATQDRRADQHEQPDVPDGGAPLHRRADGKGAGLGGRRGRRLLAYLRKKSKPLEPRLCHRPDSDFYHSLLAGRRRSVAAAGERGMRVYTILLIVAVLSAGTLAYEVRTIAPLAWHSGDEAVVMTFTTG